MKNNISKLMNTDSLLARLGLERKRSGASKALPVLAGIGLGVLAGAGLLAASQTERGKKVRAAAKKQLTRGKNGVVAAANAVKSDRHEAPRAHA